MAETTGASNGHFRLDAVRGKLSDEPPVGGTTVFWMPNNHVTYIATWYSLAALLSIIILRSKRGRIR